MRKYGKTDANQSAIVAALRAAGATVQSLASVGGGCPDLLVGYRQRTILIECKDGDKPPSARKLTDDQEQWQSFWRGSPVVIVNNVDEALAALVGATIPDPKPRKRRQVPHE